MTHTASWIPRTRGRGWRSLRRIGAVVVAIGLGVGGLAACSTAPTGSTDSATSSVRIGIAGGSTGTVLDPHVATDALNTWFAWTFYETIGAFDAEGGYSNVLADSFEPNEDATSWTLVLKDGITFHSGKPLTADDVIFTFDQILDPATAATAAGGLAVIADVAKVDDRTVRFDLTEPRGNLDRLISETGNTGIIPTDFDIAQPDSTGPWVFGSYDPGVQVQLSRFDGYHGTPAKLESVSLLAFPDADARTNALVAGQIDVDPFLAASSLPRVENDPRLTTLEFPSSEFEVVTMRVDEGLTADPRVREALRLAVDREQVVTVVDGGHARVANDLYGIDDPDYRADLVRTRDVERAKALVAEAGASGAELTLTTIGSIEPMAQIVAQNAREIGLNVTVDVRDDATFYADGYLEYPFSVDRWPASSILTIAGLTEGPGASLPYTHADDPEFNALYTTAAGTTDDAVRKEVLSQLQQILFDRGGFLIPRFMNRLIAADAGLTGWPTADPTGGLVLMQSLKNLSWTS